MSARYLLTPVIVTTATGPLFNISLNKVTMLTSMTVAITLRDENGGATRGAFKMQHS